jgi:glucuronate isomerase
MPSRDDDRLLTQPLARELFHGVARELPIIDYHNHLDALALAENHRFADLAELWVVADPYKHRAMRIAGVPEAEISGPASARQKFDHWAATVPLTLGNPLHAWTELELARTFDFTAPLSPATADTLWQAASARLASPTHSARGLVEQANTACLCTSDLLLDDLSAHAALARSGWKVKVLPSLRGDDLLAVDSPAFDQFLAALCRDSGAPLRDYDSFRAAVARRLDAFDALGCRLADHALNDFAYEPADDSATAALFARRLASVSLSEREHLRLRSGILRHLGLDYARRGWTLQLHLGAQRRTSSRLRRLAGPFGGYASLGNPTDIPALCALLDDLESAGGLPRTILYPLNPVHFPALATLTGSFAADGVPGLVQLGPAWWFNDHDLGIRQHLDVLSRYGLLSTFIGMTTDSRSFLSLARHEYFRRILCQWLAEQAAAGHLPPDAPRLAPLVRAVCHDNAARQLRLVS